SHRRMEAREGRSMRAPAVTSRSVCAVCGTPMRRDWTDDLMDFRWRAEDGTITGVAGDVPDGAPTSTPTLLQLLADRGDTQGVSTALARYQPGDSLLPWAHHHRAVEPASRTAPEDVPTCHGWPMPAAPGAWICRVDHA